MPTAGETGAGISLGGDASKSAAAGSEHGPRQSQGGVKVGKRQSADAVGFRPGKASPIRKGRPADKAMKRLLLHHAASFAGHLDRLLQDTGTEGAHQTRVAIRRLRATIAAMAPIIRPTLRRTLTRDLRALFRQIGVLRDAEVLAELYRDSPEAAALTEKRKQIGRDLRKTLKTCHADRLPRRIDASFAGKSWRRTSRRYPLDRLAVRALDRSWGKALAHGPDLAALPIAEQHDLRKSLKVFRYMAEDFAPIWPRSATEPFLTPLRALQEELGLLNDLALAEAAGLPADPARQAALLARAAALWHALHAATPWWRQA